MINFIVMTPKPVFYKALYTKSNSHMADYIAVTVAAVIRETGEDKVVAVATDNARANQAAWSSLENTFRSTRLTCIGCAAHWLNLMSKGILKIVKFKDVLTHTIGMIKFFKNKHRPNYRLADAQRSIYGALVTPVETRWMSHHSALKSFIKSKTALQRVVIAEDFHEISEGPKGVDIKRLILDDGFWANVTEVMPLQYIQRKNKIHVFCQHYIY